MPVLFSSLLSARPRQIHQRMLATSPFIERVACVIHDPQTDVLKTFIHSTRNGRALEGYQFRLAEGASLSSIARDLGVRVIDDIPAVVHPTSPHSAWLLEQGYRSSFTCALTDQGKFLGFLFIDSMREAAFTARVQRDLLLFANLINLAISSELAAVRSILASVSLARDLANLRDFETGAHLERMARISQLIARALAPTHGLSDEFVEHVHLYAPLHDVGKIGIPDDILLKEGRLDERERAVMVTHVEKGVRIIGRILGDFALAELPDSQVLLNIVRHHHELLDGSGYPAGLSGDAIPLESRIVTVADIFDALVNPRPYKTGWSIPDALAELQAMADAGKLDPACVAALCTHEAEAAELMATYRDADT